MYFVSNPVEVAYGKVKATISLLGRTASGRADMINCERALSEINAARSELAELERICRETLRTQKEEARLKRKEDREFALKQSKWLKDNPSEADRLQNKAA